MESSKPESTVVVPGGTGHTAIAIQVVCTRSGPNSSQSSNLDDETTAPTPKGRKQRHVKDDQTAVAETDECVRNESPGCKTQSTGSNSKCSEESSVPFVVSHIFRGNLAAFNVEVQSNYFEALRARFGNTHHNHMKELDEGLKDCMKEFPTPVDGNDNFPKFPKAEIACFDARAVPNSTTNVVQTTESGKTLSCSIKVRLCGDQITSGDFNVKVGMNDRMHLEMVKMFQIKQVGLSAKELQNAYQTFTELEADTSEPISDNLGDHIKTLTQIIQFIEKGQDLFRAPYAKQLEAINLGNAMNPDNPARKALFRNQSANVDVSFYIDEFKLVFRWYTQTLSEFDQFRVYACVGWLNKLSTAYENVLCKAKKLRHMLEFADELYASL